MNADRDPVVGGALDLLPVTPPSERFWADLSARLRAERPGPTLRPVPPLPESEVVELRRQRPPSRPPVGRRRVLAGLVAAGVAAAAVLAVGALQDGDDGLDTGPLGPASSSTVDPTATTGQPGVVDAPADERSAAARDAAIEWIEAIDAGDADAAWALVGDQSRAQLGSRAAFDDLMASALREGWGAWSQAADAATVAALPPEGPEIAWAVTFHGAIAQEGSTDHQSAVLLVRDVDGAMVVEPFVPGPAIGLIEQPGLGGTPEVAPGGELAISVDADIAAVLVAIDGRAVPEDDLERDGDGAVTGVRVGELTPGPHALTVAVAMPSGALAADATSFTVTS